jgi:hypothetical protein
MARLIASFLALLLFGASVGHATCQGWEASRDQRKDCCRRAHHTDCLQKGAADACCAGHQDSRQIAGPASAQSVSPVPAVTVLLPMTAAVPLMTSVLVVERAQRLLHPPSPPPKQLRI